VASGNFRPNFFGSFGETTGPYHKKIGLIESVANEAPVTGTLLQN
jgi:hypothetical protein